MSTNNLEKLNRLRVNAGKSELKSWKASQEKLDAAIKVLEDAGHTDVLPGADAGAAPKIDDPEVAAARPEPEETKDEAPALADSAMAKNIANPPKEEKKPTNGKASLARGLDSEPYARQSRERVRDLREKEKKEAKAKKIELSKADKKQIKDEAESRKGSKKKPGKIAGEVDAKKDPEKAKRQKKHVEDKQKARAEKPKAEKNPNEITVADIARELDIDPKVARAKLRRHENKLTKLHTKGQDRWTFPKTAGAEIKKILQGKK